MVHQKPCSSLGTTKAETPWNCWFKSSMVFLQASWEVANITASPILIWEGISYANVACLGILTVVQCIVYKMLKLQGNFSVIWTDHQEAKKTSIVYRLSANNLILNLPKLLVNCQPTVYQHSANRFVRCYSIFPIFFPIR